MDDLQYALWKARKRPHWWRVAIFPACVGSALEIGAKPFIGETGVTIGFCFVLAWTLAWIWSERVQILTSRLSRLIGWTA